MKRVFRIAAVIYVLTLSALIVAYIHVSVVQVEVALHLQAPKVWYKDAPNALRGVIMDGPTGRMLTGARLNFTQGEESFSKGKSEGHGYVQMPIEAPKAGRLSANVRVEHTSIEPYTAPFEVEVAAGVPAWQWPKLKTRVVPEPGRSTEVKDPSHTGELRVEPMLASKELVRGLPNTVWFRVIDTAGAPVDARVEVEKLSGLQDLELPQTIIVQHGLFSLNLQPVTALKLEFKAVDGERMGESEVWLTSVAAQYVLRMQESFLTPEGSAKGHVQALTRQSGLLVDTYIDGHWQAASAFRVANHEGGIEVFHRPGRMARVQIYESFFGVGTAWDSRYVVLTDELGVKGCRDALRHALRLVDTAGQKVWAEAMMWRVGGFELRECNRVLEATLQLIPTNFEEPPVLLSTKAQDQEKLDAWIAEVQGRIMIAIVFALLIGFLFVVVLVVQGVAARRTQAMAMLEASVLEDGEDEIIERFGPLLFYTQVAILLGTVGLFGAGLVLILGLL